MSVPCMAHVQTKMSQSHVLQSPFNEKLQSTHAYFHEFTFCYSHRYIYILKYQNSHHLVYC